MAARTIQALQAYGLAHRRQVPPGARNLPPMVLLSHDRRPTSAAWRSPAVASREQETRWVETGWNAIESTGGHHYVTGPREYLEQRWRSWPSTRVKNAVGSAHALPSEVLVVRTRRSVLFCTWASERGCPAAHLNRSTRRLVGMTRHLSPSPWKVTNHFGSLGMLLSLSARGTDKGDLIASIGIGAAGAAILGAGDAN